MSKTSNNNIVLSGRRFIHIDYLETLAIFFVLLYHCGTVSRDFISTPSASAYFNYFWGCLLSTCVCIFFFVNGYLLFSKRFDLRKHIYKTLRLIAIAVAWGFIKMFALMPIRNEYFSFFEIVRAVYKQKIGWINSLWFLGALVCIYFFFPLLKVAYDNYPKVFIYFIILSFILTFCSTFLNEILTILFSTSHHKGIPYRENFFNMFNALRGFRAYTLVYFCLGGLFFRYEPIIKSFDKKREMSSRAFL